MAITGIGFDNIEYHSWTVADYGDQPQNNITSLKIDYPSSNQIAFRTGSRMSLGGYNIKIEGDELITLPTSVAIDTTFYFSITVDNPNQKFSDIQFTTIEPLSLGTHENKLICPFGKIVAKKGTVFLDSNPDNAKSFYEDYLVNLVSKPIKHLALEVNSYINTTIPLTPFTIMGKKYKPTDFQKMIIVTSDFNPPSTPQDFDVQQHHFDLQLRPSTAGANYAFMDISLICSRYENNVIVKRMNLNNDWTLIGNDSNNNDAEDKDVVIRAVFFVGLDPYAKGEPI